MWWTYYFVNTEYESDRHSLQTEVEDIPVDEIRSDISIWEVEFTDSDSDSSVDIRRCVVKYSDS